MRAIPVRITSRTDPGPTSSPAPVPADRSACHAPNAYMVLYPDGVVRVCCISNQILGRVTRTPLTELWFGATRTELAERLGSNDFSMGCEGCGAEIAAEGRAGSYPATFDRYADSRPDAWPRTIYFNLSNACNLQCVQCDGELSSSIRRHRERLPALPRLYGDAFFEELRPFIYHLERAEFAGGEPFLAPETYRVLDLIHELAPDLPCSVITNGTQWNSRIEAALERHRFDVKLSLDGITRSTYESIRIGAVFDDVLANAERLLDYTRRRGTRFEIAHCLMPSNVHEFADLLSYADSLDVPVSVSVVRDPAEHSIAHLAPDEIASIHGEMIRRNDEVRSRPGRNGAVWRSEMDRIGVWAANPSSDLRGHDQHRVMWFPRQGTGPTDDATARRELRERSSDGRVYEIRVGPGQTITRVVDDLASLVGAGATDLVGRHIRSLIEPLADRFGRPDSMADFVIVAQDDDRVDQTACFPSAELHLCTLALRDASGVADEAAVLIARVL